MVEFVKRKFKMMLKLAMRNPISPKHVFEDSALVRVCPVRRDAAKPWAITGSLSPLLLK